MDKCQQATHAFGAPHNNSNNSGSGSGSSNHASPSEFLDSDTPLGPFSLLSARKFCGAAMFAVDCVLGTDMAVSVSVPTTSSTTTGTGTGTDTGSTSSRSSTSTSTSSSITNVDRVFVLGRPPGHHAGPHGCVASPSFWKRPEMTSSGFCLLNTGKYGLA